MVEIPDRADPTLDAVNAVIEKAQEPYATPNIGFGLIGHNCNRHIWYKINLLEPEVFRASTLRIFRGGHRSEEFMAADLRAVECIELHTHDPGRGNKQYKADFLDGRLTGRIDGAIRGLLQAPQAWHVWEHKEVKEEKYKKLLKSKGTSNNAKFHEWDAVYYAQSQLNMLGFGMDRHYLTVSTPAQREVTSLRTELDKKYAESLVDKADRIIKAKEPPERIGGADYYECKFCRFYGACHGKG